MKDFLSAARDAVFIAAIYLFFIGYIYRYYYLNRLGVSAGYDDKLLMSILVYSYTVADEAAVRTGLAFVQHPFASMRWVVLIGLAVAALVIVCMKWPRAKDLAQMRGVRLMALVVIAIGMFPALAHLASSIATQDADDDRLSNTANPVAVVLNNESPSDYDDKFVQDAKRNYSLRLISESSDSYYFLQTDDTLTPNRQQGVIYAVPRDRVLRVDTILPTLEEKHK